MKFKPNLFIQDYEVFNINKPSDRWELEHTCIGRYPKIEVQNVYREGEDWYYGININEHFEFSIHVSKGTVLIMFAEPVEGRVLIHHA